MAQQDFQKASTNYRSTYLLVELPHVTPERMTQHFGPSADGAPVTNQGYSGGWSFDAPGRRRFVVYARDGVCRVGATVDVSEPEPKTEDFVAWINAKLGVVRPGV